MAKKHAPDAHDLLHHTYMRCVGLEFPDNFMGYMAVSMFREATRGQFKRVYHIAENQGVDVAAPDEGMETAMQREYLQIMIDRLNWFDRTILTLYIEGWKLVEIANATGIPVGTLYQSIHKSKKAITDAICRLPNAAK